MRPNRSARSARRSLRATLTALVCAALAALLLSAAPATADDSRPAQTHTVVGGTLIHSAQGSCPVAFNARGGQATYAIMAGTCGPSGTQWFADPALTIPVGVTGSSTHPSPQYSLLHYTGGGNYPAMFFNGRGNVRVSGLQQPMIGSSICQWSSTLGLHCGTITGINQTINYPGGGILYGLIRSSVCSGPGDLGMPAFAGDRAIGFVIGGSGNCTTGGTTFYQPLAPILSAHALTLVY
jgi:streptogrisin B